MRLGSIAICDWMPRETVQDVLIKLGIKPLMHIGNKHFTGVEWVEISQKIFARFFDPRMFVRSQTILRNIYYTFLMQGKALEFTFFPQGQTFM